MSKRPSWGINSTSVMIGTIRIISSVHGSQSYLLVNCLELTCLSTLILSWCKNWQMMNIILAKTPKTNHTY